MKFRNFAYGNEASIYFVCSNFAVHILLWVEVDRSVGGQWHFTSESWDGWKVGKRDRCSDFDDNFAIYQETEFSLSKGASRNNVNCEKWRFNAFCDVIRPSQVVRDAVHDIRLLSEVKQADK